MKRIGYLVIVSNYETIGKRYYIYRCFFTGDFDFNSISDIDLIDHTDSKAMIKILIDVTGMTCRKIEKMNKLEWRLYYV